MPVSRVPRRPQLPRQENPGTIRQSVSPSALQPRSLFKFTTPTARGKQGPVPALFGIALAARSQDGLETAIVRYFRNRLLAGWIEISGAWRSSFREPDVGPTRR